MSVANAVISKRKVEKIYELEYKMSQLERQRPFSDRQYFYYSKWKEEASKLANDLIRDLYGVLSIWVDVHEQQDEYQVYHLAKEAKDKLAWAKKPQASLKDKILAINYALHVKHFNGKMFVLGEEEMGLDGFMLPNQTEVINQYQIPETTMSQEETNEYLSDLSEGVFISNWDKALSQLRANKMDWYKMALQKEAIPYIHEVKPNIYDIGKNIKSLDHIDEVYVFGSFVNQGAYSDYKMKDLDIVAVVDFTESQMRQCVFGDFSYFDDVCDEVVDFTEKFINLYPRYNLDPWVITSDGQLLHWGPLADEDDFLQNEMRFAAWEFADSQVDINIEDYGFDKPDDITEDKLNAIQDEVIREELEEFKEVYDDELDNIMYSQFNHGPQGWYSFGDELTVQDIMQQGLKIA
jgi:hypothetical protein